MVRWRAFRLRFLQLGLVLPLLLPITLGLGQTTAQAYSYCAYWTGNLTSYVTASDNSTSGINYTSYVRYKECLDSNLNPTLLNVNYFSETVTYSGGQYHQSVQFALCGSSNPYYLSCGSVVGWTSSTSGGCSGACTVWRGGYVNLTVGYNTTAAIFERWSTCLNTPYGDNFCDSFHQFVAHRGYFYDVGYS